MTSQDNSSVGFSPVMARNLKAQGWSVVDLLDEVDSTNAHALREPCSWHLVAAHAQNAGRGRLDRRWQVPPGAAVTMSMTLPLPAEAADWGWVPLFVGDAVRAAIDDVGDGDVQVATKWPNDVLVRDDDGEWRKVCGVLCQIVTGPRPLVVAGVGVNVTQGREELPVPSATSLALAGVEVTRDELVERIAAETRRSALLWSSSDAEVRTSLEARVRAHCRTIGQQIEVHTPDGSVTHRQGDSIDSGGRLVTRPLGSRPGQGPTMVYSVADVVHARITG